MSALDPATFLAPVTSEDPSGPNLENDPAYQELERLAKGKEERQIGDTVQAAEEPDWKAVERLSSGLLGQSKDLRVGIHLASALLRTQGWPGLAAGLGVLRGLTENFWEVVHPHLDRESDNDPIERSSALLNLTQPTLLAAIRTTPLITSRVFGKITLRDVEAAAGEGAGAGSNGHPVAPADSVDAAAAEVDLATLAATAGAVRAASEALAGMEAAFAGHAGAGMSPNLTPFSSLLKKVRSFLDGKLSQRQPAEEGNGATNDPAAGPSAAPTRALSGEIGSREDVIRALEKIIAYYARHEPSSPVPVLVERCKRLASMSFIEIIRDMVPDAINQVEVFKGRSES
jgi:type VI secretion system protein ImpA